MSSFCQNWVKLSMKTPFDPARTSVKYQTLLHCGHSWESIAAHLSAQANMSICGSIFMCNSLEIRTEGDLRVSVCCVFANVCLCVCVPDPLDTKKSTQCIWPYAQGSAPITYGRVDTGGVAVRLQLISVLSACRIAVSLRQARSTSCRWFQTIVSSQV